jgi:hypothetical protein
VALVFDYNTRIIQIPKADLLLVSTVPSEVRQLDINDLRLWLHDEQDDERGIVFVKMFDNQPPKTISGVTLARVLEILDPWTIEFDDTGGTDLYSVNIVGGNSNLADVIVKNTVGVNTANSAGLQDPFALQAGAFFNEVSLDTVNGVGGTTFPRGTRAFPVSSVADAITIAELRGLRTIRVLSTMTLGSGDFSDGYTFIGESVTVTTVTVQAGSNVANCTFREMTIEGTLDNNNTFDRCEVLDVTMFSGQISYSGLAGTVTLATAATADIVECHSGYAGGGAGAFPYINFGGASAADCLVRNWSGGLGIQNMTSATSDVSIDIQSGRVTIDADCTAGDITIRGNAEVTDNSGGATVSDKTLQRVVWDDIVEGTLTAEDAIRLLLAVAVGKSDSANPVTFRDQADTKDRVSATMTGSDRTTVVLDATP